MGRVSFVMAGIDSRLPPLAQKQESAKDGAPNLSSEQDHIQTGDDPEVALIAGEYGVVKRERGDPDQQVGKGNDHASGRLFPIDASGKQCGLFRVWIDGQRNTQLINKQLTAQTHLRCSCSIDAMDQFGESYGRKRSFLIACQADGLLDQLRGGISATLGGNHYTGIQN